MCRRRFDIERSRWIFEDPEETSGPTIAARNAKLAAAQMARALQNDLDWEARVWAAQQPPWYRVEIQDRQYRPVDHPGIGVCSYLATDFGIPVWLTEDAADLIQDRTGCEREEAYARLVHNLHRMQRFIPTVQLMRAVPIFPANRVIREGDEVGPFFRRFDWSQTAQVLRGHVGRFRAAVRGLFP